MYITKNYSSEINLFIKGKKKQLKGLFLSSMHSYLEVI